MESGLAIKRRSNMPYHTGKKKKKKKNGGKKKKKRMRGHHGC